MMGLEQGCQMVSFQTKNSNLGKFWRALGEKLLIQFMAILEYFTDVWDILWPFGTICVSFGTFFQVLVSCTEKNLATLDWNLDFRFPRGT
jgi:hypothetical protein